MFHSIHADVLSRMHDLEALDAQDREDGTPRLQRLRQIPPETGQFVALTALMAPEGRYIEIGTSAGYSTMWLGLACRQLGRKITTFEVMDEKIARARETFSATQMGDVVELIHGDARDHLASLEEVAFCFLDAEKEIYSDCYELVVPRLVPGGILVADNAINKEKELRPMLDRALADERVDAMIVRIGKGELVCRKM